MKILLVSDTHGQDVRLEEVLETEQPDFLCHMGDVEGSQDYISEIALCPAAIIAGNNDYFSDLPRELVLELEGHRIYMTHGHLHYVHGGLEDLMAAARERKADIVLFGHIHRPVTECSCGIYMINPGSLTYPRQKGHQPTYGVMDLEKGKEPKVEIHYL